MSAFRGSHLDRLTPDDCDECGGSGDCPECDGENYADCTTCDGSGECPGCDGNGTEEETE